MVRQRSKATDNFSHRTEISFDSGVFDIQMSIAEEALARLNNGSVSKISYPKFFVRSNLEISDFELLTRALQAVNSSSSVIKYENHKNNHFSIGCFDEKHVVKISGPLFPNLINDEDDDYFPHVSKQKYSDDAYYTIEVSGNEHTIEAIVQNFVKDFGFVFAEREDDKRISVRFAYPGLKGNIEVENRRFDALSLSMIEKNYVPEVIIQIQTMLEIVENSQHGLVLLNGPVGTGKSYLIRAILTELAKQRRKGVVCIPALTFLNSAAALLPVTSSYGKTAIIFEDVGDLLSSDSKTKYIDETSNLLNFSEGLLSLLADCIVFITFNHEIEKIDEAIVRYGRCLAQIEVPKLSFEQAKRLVKFELSEKKEYALSEIYEMNRVNKQIVSRRTKARGSSQPLGLAR